MDEHHDARGLDGTVATRRLDIEIRELRAAMALVASGSSPRVRLTGLRFGNELLRRFRDDADRDGLRLVEEPWPDDAGCNITVEALHA
jgi:hypothetical protein